MGGGVSLLGLAESEDGGMGEIVLRTEHALFSDDGNDRRNEVFRSIQTFCVAFQQCLSIVMYFRYKKLPSIDVGLRCRTQLLGQLRASGFVRARGGGDIRDLNSNSENWAVVKAALCAGMYPNIIHVDRERKQLTTTYVS